MKKKSSPKDVRVKRLELMITEILNYEHFIQTVGVDADKHDVLLRKARKAVGWVIPKSVKPYK